MEKETWKWKSNLKGSFNIKHFEPAVAGASEANIMRFRMRFLDENVNRCWFVGLKPFQYMFTTWVFLVLDKGIWLLLQDCENH